MAILRTSKTILAAKAESSYGTAVTLAGSDCFLIQNMSLNPVAGDAVERPNIRGFAGNFPTFPSETRVELSFDVELTPSGTAGTRPDYDCLLLASGMAVADVSSTSNTYTPDPTLNDATSLTFGIYIDGSLHKVFGARGSFTINLETGQAPMLSFNFIGIYSDPVVIDSNNPQLTPSYTQLAPIAANSGNTVNFQLHSYAGALQSFTYNHNNALYYSELISGTKSTRITDRKPEGNVVIESVGLATKNFYSIKNSSATGNLTWEHGTSAGDTITFTAPYTDINDIQQTDNEGYQMLSMGYRALPSSGNDEMSLVYS